MSDILDRKFINLETTRSTLKQKILRDRARGLDFGYYELSVRPLYIRAWHLYCSFFIMHSEMEKCSYTDRSRVELEQIFWQDHQALLFYGAPYSWLVIKDEDKFENWKELNSDATKQRIPTSINYGLILKHFLPLSAVCNYLAGFNVEEHQAKLPQQNFKRIEEYASQYVHVNMKDPTLTIEKVREMVSDIEMQM
jgi:hypothetical protein